ncbi:MAG: exopolysaccharide biosynthesis protein [Rhodospirillales bacterium]|nr:exopolysaccharide biosynthesis protein [Rhodospirillales bacterium]
MNASTERTSDRLRRAVAGGTSTRVSIDDLVAALSDRAFGVLLLILALPISIPTIPGMSVICGTPILLLSLQMMIGHQRPWLPSKLGQRSFARTDIEAMLNKAMPYILKFERIARPRIEWLTDGVFERVAGIVIFVMAVIIVLPTPPIVGNIPSAVAIAVLSIGFIERDGLITILGYVLAGLAVVATFGIVAALIAGAMSLFHAWMD